MKTTAIILAITATALFASQFIAHPSNDHDHHWTAWKMQYGKAYGTNSEENVRRSIFYENLEIANNWNNSGNSANLGTNQFADLTNTEFGAMYLGTRPAQTLKGKPFNLTTTAPASKDWRQSGAVSGVKNQGQCGSCWAFSTTGSLEGAHFLGSNKLESFSEQQLVDCSHSGNMGCNGGSMEIAFTYFETNDAILEENYAYTAKDGTCQYEEKEKTTVEVASYVRVEADSTDALKASIAKGPTSVAIEADKTVFQHYTSGVMDSIECGTKLDHGVLAVGYGSEQGIIEKHDYIIVKNSWGATWGEEGYIKLGVRSGKGECGINQDASRPLAN